MELIHGDCLQEMKKIPDHSVDMILADLPYGITACSWDIVIPFEPLWEQYKRIIKGNGAIVLFGNEPFSSYLRISNIKWFRYDIVWNKKKPSNFQLMNFQPGKIHEMIHIFSKGPAVYCNGKNMNYYPVKTKLAKPYSGGQLRGTKNSTLREGNSIKDLGKHEYTDKHPYSIIEFTNANIKIKIHPTEKPQELLRYLIYTFSKEGDLILDNCMGSGSTGIACLNTNRDFIGIELYPLPDKPISKTNPDYFGIAKNRIAKWKFEPTEDSKDEQINLF